MSGECDQCGKHDLNCECEECTIRFNKFEFPDFSKAVVSEKSGEIIRTREWITKEEAIQIFPNFVKDE